MGAEVAFEELGYCCCLSHHQSWQDFKTVVRIMVHHELVQIVSILFTKIELEYFVGVASLGYSVVMEMAVAMAVAVAVAMAVAVAVIVVMAMAMVIFILIIHT